MNAYISKLIHSIKTTENLNEVSLIETHISWVLLTGKYAYKIKKPVNLGFLDFSSLEKRKFYCLEELRLNSRLAPDIYLSVVTITGSVEQPVLNGQGKIIDYAVKMKEFPKQAELSYVVEKKQLSNKHVDNLAEAIAYFHQKIDKSTSNTQWGTAELTHQTTLDTFDNLLKNLSDSKTRSRVLQIKNWSNEVFNQYKTDFKYRHDLGYIRECHGDLHLHNIALVENEIILFDGIEFNASLRWIDVVSEIAFLIMDLQHQNLKMLSFRFLNNYLEHTGDYQGLRLLRYYLVYRSVVRSMVAALRVNQIEISNEITNKEYKQLISEVNDYITLAETYINESYSIKNKPMLLICHGLSASGKSTISQTILERLPAIRLRSDVERKRLFGLERNQKSNSAIGKNIYNSNATTLTYDTLQQLAGYSLKNGYNVIVDATFLSQNQRNKFKYLATTLQSSFIILDFIASEETLRERIKSRSKNVNEASEADINVLKNQLKNSEPLSEVELDSTCKIDTEVHFDFSCFQQKLNEITLRKKDHVITS